MTSDLDLLRQFARENSQDAFGEIVRRHLPLVYSAAVRQVRSAQLAEDVAQSVFADLAREARALKPDTVLAAWLYAVARRTAIDTVRKESRRQLREQIAVEMNNMNATADDWKQIAPLLDDAMAALEETDRTAILLRYFENKSLRDVGENLNITDDAAQKRVSRAVERLREFFTKERVTIGAAGLVALMSANAVQAAPAGLAAAISGTTLATTSTLIAATKTIAMTTIQKSIIVAALATAAGTAIYAAHQNSKLRGQIQTLQQQQAPLTAQIQQLQQERDEATNQLSGLLEDNARLDSNSSELLALRNEVAQLNKTTTTARKKTITVGAPWQEWNNHQKIGSFFAVAGTATETVAVGIDGRIATRNNSTGVWNVQTFTGDPDFRAIIYADNQYVVVREKGSIMTSPNGIDWTKRDSPTKENLMGVFWDGRQYLAGGDKGTILSSPDGIQWTVCNSGGNVSIYCFSYSGTRYIAVGNDGVFTSDDAITWTASTNAPQIPFTACTWTGSEFLACGLVPTIYTSPDGDDWTMRDDTMKASFRAAITVNGTVYVSGDSIVAKSVDGGTTWTNTFENSRGNALFMGLANDGEDLIAVGFNHNVWSLPLSEAQ